MSRTGQPSEFELSWFARALVVLAAIRIGAAAVMLVLEPQSETLSSSAIGVWMVALQVITFSVAAAVLLLAHARDARTANLGMSLLIIGSAFASSHFADLAARFPWLSVLTTWYPDAFLAVFIGRFVRDFPHRHRGRADQILRVLIAGALVSGVILFAANALRALPFADDAGGLRLLQRRSEGGTVYWTAIFAFVAVMLPLAFTGASTWRREERHRVRFFWGAFVVGLGPIVLLVVLGSLPRIGPRLMTWATTGWMLPFVELLLASVPLTVAYAVLVQRLLPLRVIIHQALQYVFAQWAVSALALVPIGLLIAQGYQHRDETIAAAMSGRMLWLVGAFVVSAGAVVGRPKILLLIDRWFLREAYDSRAVLIELSERARRAHGIDELVAIVTAGIDRALRPEKVAVLVRGADGQHFLSLFGAAEPLPAGSVLVDIVSALDGAPLDVNVDDERSPLKWLPRPERQWLADNQSVLLVPLSGSGGLLVGAISLGARKSELPYSAEDRRLLSAMADAAALTIENHAYRITRDPAHDAGGEHVSPWWRVGAAQQHVLARECPDCGSVEAAEAAECRRCRAALQVSDVPQVLFGKFRFEERVGRGGMGVVYRATDLMLERTVAIKTLPGTSPEYSQRLRLEAKAMAAVTHRNLGTIHGVESWRGRPMLVCEFMEHGTLESRLKLGPMPVGEAIELGLALADALQVIHRAGLLHRDIKPSNIGFGAGRVPKLLDFGLAYMISEAEDLAARAAVVGTPLYMSPEATTGRAPTQMFDLWSLNVLLLEAISGTHPFRGRTTEETMSLIRDALKPRSVDRLRGPHAKVAEYFEDALAKDSHRRPRSAAELAARLRAIAH
jgi:GAF domain-containing protein